MWFLPCSPSAFHSATVRCRATTREDLPLLEVEMLQQRRSKLVDERREMLGPFGGRVGDPARQRHVQLLDEALDAVVLGLHRVDQLGRRGRSVEQERPEQLVLTVWWTCKRLEHERQVVSDDAGAVGVAGGGPADEPREGGKLPPEDAVDDHHLVDVGCLRGGRGRGHGVLLSVGSGRARCLQRRHARAVIPGTRPAHHSHSSPDDRRPQRGTTTRPTPLRRSPRHGCPGRPPRDGLERRCAATALGQWRGPVHYRRCRGPAPRRAA